MLEDYATQSSEIYFTPSSISNILGRYNLEKKKNLNQSSSTDGMNVYIEKFNSKEKVLKGGAREPYITHLPAHFLNSYIVKAKTSNNASEEIVVYMLFNEYTDFLVLKTYLVLT